ncbi:MAG: hypothetical protein KA170_10385 [Candidatus Promineofilum sp.]|nr:hypothetical protein [Promineifilum sp.]
MRTTHSVPRWRPLLDAALITLFVLALFFHWFGLANRYVLFLYGHSAPGIPLTQPFDAMTASRYWMSGLVAAGAVLLLYVAANWLGGRFAAQRGRSFGAPSPWSVWRLCALPLAVGIPLITMTVNAPTLPLSLAAAATATTLAGLAVGLPAGRWAAERPGDLLWLAADGLGLVPALVLLRAVELPGRGLSVSPVVAWGAAVAGLVAGAVWLGLLGFLRRRRRREAPGAVTLFAAGLAHSYLLLPLAHYLLAGPPGGRYISDAANFFAVNPLIQLLTLAVAAALAAGATAVRRRTTARQLLPT